MPQQLLPLFLLCVALASVETLHGIARTVLLQPRLGRQRAKRLSIVTGSLLAFGVCWLLVPRVGLQTLPQHLWLGAGLALFMAAFDIAIGRGVLRLPWAAVLAEFNPFMGHLLILGLALLTVFPALVWWIRASAS